MTAVAPAPRRTRGAGVERLIRDRLAEGDLAADLVREGFSRSTVYKVATKRDAGVSGFLTRLHRLGRFYAAVPGVTEAVGAAAAYVNSRATMPGPFVLREPGFRCVACAWWSPAGDEHRPSCPGA